MLACGAWWRVEARNAFHISITATRICLLFRGPSQGEEGIQARLGAIRAPEPDRPLANEIGDNDAIGVSPAERDLVESNDAGSWRSVPPELLAHVLLLQRLDGVPIQPQVLGHIPNCRRPTAAPHVEGKALGVEGIVRHTCELLSLHLATVLTRHAADLDVEADP